MKAKYWTCGSGRIELQISLEDAEGCSHAGQCDDDVMALSQTPSIAAQLAKIDPQTLADELGEYGAWDDDELTDHAQNLQRILWLACCDIAEDPDLYNEEA
jgi:hypothetical protein